jgi:hypothetical protein
MVQVSATFWKQNYYFQIYGVPSLNQMKLSGLQMGIQYKKQDPDRPSIWMVPVIGYLVLDPNIIL